MKTSKIVVLVTISLVLALLTGCGKQEGESKQTSKEGASSAIEPRQADPVNQQVLQDVVDKINAAVKYDLTPNFVFGRFWQYCTLHPYYDFEKMEVYAGYTGGYVFKEGAPFGTDPTYDTDKKGYLVEFGGQWGGKEKATVQFRNGKVGSCKAITTFVAEGTEAKIGEKIYIFLNGKWTKR